MIDEFELKKEKHQRMIRAVIEEFRSTEKMYHELMVLEANRKKLEYEAFLAAGFDTDQAFSLLRRN